MATREQHPRTPGRGASSSPRYVRAYRCAGTLARRAVGARELATVWGPAVDRARVDASQRLEVRADLKLAAAVAINVSEPPAPTGPVTHLLGRRPHEDTLQRSLLSRQRHDVQLQDRAAWSR